MKENIIYSNIDEDVDEFWLDDERANLNVEVDGIIVGFADLGLWNGRVKGARIFGNNVKNILKSYNEYNKWYCDQHNVRCISVHHDGRNKYLYRVAKNVEQAERIKDKIVSGVYDEEKFRKATRSLKPYVAKVYGW